MAELYLFSQDDEFLTILSEEEGLVDTWFKDYENHVEDESFVFSVESNSPLLEHISEENQAAFYDRDGRLRLVRMKDLREVTTSDGGMISHQIRVICEPSFLELHDHFIEDRRIADGTAQTALNRALDGSRYIGEVTVDLGLATDNFYWIDGIEAVFKILKTWGGALKDTITLNEDNEIIERKLWIVQRLGTDNGLIVEPDYNAEEISRNTLSYPETALWGQGASLEIEDDEGEHTGGYTRYLTFEDVEWKVSNGDPVDKPLGQKWVGDPDALKSDGDGYKHSDGTRKHRFGHFSNQDYEDPEELLWATWQELQERKLKEVMHEATIYETDKKVSLGDTVTVLDRNYNKPIELQSQITGLEYDVFYPDDEIKIVVGKYVDMNEDPLQKEVDDLKEDIRKPRPTKPIDNGSFPDIKPGTPVNVEAHGSFQQIHLFWDYDSKVYISHYEVYGSQISDFVPDEQHLLYRGRVSAFNHEVATDEKWYYYVRAVNTRGTEGEFSNRVDASPIRVISDDILFGNVLAEHLEDNLDLANKLSDGTLDWINEEPLYEIRESENRILSDVGNRIGDILNDIDLIEDDLGELRYQDVEINNRIDGLSTIVQDTTGVLDDLTGEVGHQSTQISKWEQRADGFEQSVVDVEGDLENAWTEISTFQQTATDLTLSVSELWTDFEDLEIGGRNLLRNTSSEWETVSWSNWNEYPNGNTSRTSIEVIPNEEYVFTVEYKDVITSDSVSVGVRIFWRLEDGSNTETGNGQLSVSNGESGIARITAKAPSDAKYGIAVLRKYSRGGSGSAEYRYAKFEKGTKATDWSPAPEDMADRANLISYINLSTEGVRIHGEKVHISGQTIIDDGIIGTAAIANLAVEKFHLNYGIIDNVHIADATIEHGKIRSVNADKITVGDLKGIDIYGAKFRSSAGTDYMEIVGGEIDLRLNNGRYMYLSPTGLYGYNQGGGLRFQADSSLVTSAAFGTSNANVYLATSDGGEARVVRYSSLPAGGSASDYLYRHIRSLSMKAPPGSNAYVGTDGEFRVMSEGLYNQGTYRDTRMNKLFANEHETNGGDILYLRASSRVRVYGTGSSSSLSDLEAGRLYNNAMVTNTDNAYIGVNSELRVTNKNLSGVYRDIRFNKAFANEYETNAGDILYLRTNARVRVQRTGSSSSFSDIEASTFYGTSFVNNRASYIYLGSDSGVRVTSQGTASNNPIVYRNIYAAGFLERSSRKSKDNIRSVSSKGLDVINKLNIVNFDYIDGDKNNIGVIAEEANEISDGEFVSLSDTIFYNTLAIQEVDLKFSDKVISIVNRINILELENQYLKQKIKQLEEKVA